MNIIVAEKSALVLVFFFCFVWGILVVFLVFSFKLQHPSLNVFHVCKFAAYSSCLWNSAIEVKITPEHLQDCSHHLGGV